MIDFRKLFAGLGQVLSGADFPDADTIAERLGLDNSAARISKTKRGLLTIYGARLGGAVDADVIGSRTPRRAVNLLFTNSKIPYQDVKGEIFGTDQKLQRSKLSEGFAILFQSDELTCGLTVSGPLGVVESVFCEGPRSAPAG